MSEQFSKVDFLNDLEREDELGAVIRAHFYIEYYVDDIIKLLVHDPSKLKPIKLDFDGKLSLINALGVTDAVKAPLSAMGSLRNKFAHRPNFKLGKLEINNLYKSLAPKDKEWVSKGYTEIIERSEHEGLPPYKDLPPKEKFILIAIVIRARVMIVRDEIKSKIA